MAAGPLVVGYSAVTSVFLPFWIGKENGFYKKEGLDTQLVYIASSTTMAQAMFAREVAISTVNSGSVVTSTLQGGDLVLIGAVMNAAAFYIMTRPEIANVQDLKGKKIGVTRLGSSSDFAIREYLQKNKLQPNRDVSIVQVGGMPELAAALNNGSISAAPLSSPSSHIAEQKGNQSHRQSGQRRNLLCHCRSDDDAAVSARAAQRRQDVSARVRTRDAFHVSTKRRGEKDSDEIRQDR